MSLLDIQNKAYVNFEKFKNDENSEILMQDICRQNMWYALNIIEIMNELAKAKKLNDESDSEVLKKEIEIQKSII